MATRPVSTFDPIRISVVVGGAIFVGTATAQALGLFGGGSPTIASPVPVPMVLPLLFGVPHFIVPVVIALFFLGWVSPVLIRADAQPTYPLRSWVLLALVGVASLTWYRTGWSYGERYEGLEYTLWCAGLSAALFVLALIAAITASKWRHHSSYIVANAITFAWIGTYAFPWFGEVI